MTPTIDLFNESWYLQHNSDVAIGVARGMFNAREHFLQFGRFEGRAPGPLFDPAYYVASNPDVAEAISRGVFSAYDHFVQFGMAEDRSPLSLFDAAFYLEQNADVADAVAAGQMSAVQHFLIFGQGEPRYISPSIDLAAYLAANTDVDTAVQAGQMSALEHLMLFGFNEGRDLGNGLSLAMFANDPTFLQAVGNGDAAAALSRVDQVAPFLPGFQPPPNWHPASDTLIVIDYTPPAGIKLVVPEGVVVPNGTVLPGTYQQPPAPDTGGDVPPATFTLHPEFDSVSSVSFGGTATGDIVLSIDSQGIGAFSRGGVAALPAIENILTYRILGSETTETLRLASTIKGHSEPVTYETLHFNGAGGSDKLILADGGNELNLEILQVFEVKGGSGADTIVLLNKADGLVIDGAGGHDRLKLLYASPNEASSVRIRNVESVEGNSQTYDSVTLLDSPTIFEFDGGGRSDNLTLSDSANNISLILSDSIERVDGGVGDDVISLVKDANGLLVMGGGGTNSVELAQDGSGSSIHVGQVGQVMGSQSNDTVTLRDAPGVFKFTGNGGTDTLILSDAGNTIALTLSGARYVNGGASDDVITITAKDGDLAINGNDGNDRITAGAGADVIDGGDGNDTYVYASASDSHILGGTTPASGFDVVTVTAGDIFDFSMEVNSIINYQITVRQAAELNGDGLLAQLDNAFRGAKQDRLEAEAPDDGIDAMVIRLGDEIKAHYLVVDIDANDSLTSDDVIIELVGAFATWSSVGLTLGLDGRLTVIDMPAG